jgi:hypothetical protein
LVVRSRDKQQHGVGRGHKKVVGVKRQHHGIIGYLNLPCTPYFIRSRGTVVHYPIEKPMWYYYYIAL